MNSSESFKRILCSFASYYSIRLPNAENKVEITKPFSAEAEFKSHTEQYFLVKSAKLSESDSSEHVFFYVSKNINSSILSEIENIAWETGISRVNPCFGHRNTDITLVIIADKFEDDIFSKIRKINHYKSYCFTFKGWSRFRIIAQESSSGKVACNRFATDLKKIFV